MKHILRFLIAMTFTPVFGQTSYTTSCEIKNGRAYGYVHNHKNSFTIDGDVWFYFYDANGHFIDSEDEYEYEYVSSKSSEEIEDTNAPSNACSCTFDVRHATDAPSTTITPYPTTTTPQAPISTPQATYTTSCEIKNGRAYGYVHNHKGSFEIDGDVWFYFYDANGHFLDSEDEYEYEYVSSKTTEEIEDTNIPMNTKSCYFEIKDAIKD
ncbi:MAG: hypothetical protein MI810_21340 [Flavobacteriales bacterium]|nr:hypothetical protein [Flavobacteriales bacterium]